MGAEPVRDPEGQRLARERAAMVETQLRLRGIRDERVLAAMGNVPRERFVPEFDRSQAYADGALPIDAGQSISQPYMVARMTELLAVRPGDRVLEIGTGSGYQAAILANLGARVLSFERHAELAAEARRRLELLGFADAVEIRVADGSLGDPTASAFDGIVVTAAAPSIPGALLEQLAEGGRLVIPVGSRDRQQLVVATRHGDDWDQRSDGECVFVPLVGAGGWPE